MTSPVLTSSSENREGGELGFQNFEYNELFSKVFSYENARETLACTGPYTAVNHACGVPSTAHPPMCWCGVSTSSRLPLLAHITGSGASSFVGPTSKTSIHYKPDYAIDCEEYHVQYSATQRYNTTQYSIIQ